MKHSDGIEVSIQLRGQRLKECANQYEKRSSQYNGAYGSRLISAVPNTEFDIVVKFHPSFRRFSSDGVLVTIATRSGGGHGTERVQSTWLEFGHANIHPDHRFSAFILFAAKD